MTPDIWILVCIILGGFWITWRMWHLKKPEMEP